MNQPVQHVAALLGYAPTVPFLCIISAGLGLIALHLYQHEPIKRVSWPARGYLFFYDPIIYRIYRALSGPSVFTNFTVSSESQYTVFISAKAIYVYIYNKPFTIYCVSFTRFSAKYPRRWNLAVSPGWL